MKVLFDHQIFATQRFGGVSRYFVELARALIEYEHIDASIFAPASINEYIKDCDCLHPLSFRLEIPNRGLRFRPMMLQPLLDMVVKQMRPNILHETYYTTQSRKSTKNMRVITTVHDMISELHPEWGVGFDMTAKQKFLSLMRADYIICVSDNTRNDLIRLYPELVEKTATVYHGVSDRTVALTDDRIYPGSYILYVGVRAGYKNFKTLLKAVANSSYLANNFALVCFGGGRFTSDELELLNTYRLSGLKVTQLSGDDELLSRAYRDAAVMVFPSLYEGFGMPLIEAMKHGCPVCCSNSSCLPEICGHAAQYFQAEDPESIRSALEMVLGNSSELLRLSNLGKEQSEKYSWRQCAKDTLSIYERASSNYAS